MAARNPVTVTPPKGRRQTCEALKADTYEALKADGVRLGLVPEGETSKALKADACEALKADGVRLGLVPHADGEGRRRRLKL